MKHGSRDSKNPSSYQDAYLDLSFLTVLDRDGVLGAVFRRMPLTAAAFSSPPAVPSFASGRSIAGTEVSSELTDASPLEWMDPSWEDSPLAGDSPLAEDSPLSLDDSYD